MSQILFLDGTTAVKDSIHDLAATKTGGVGGAWTESSNLQTLLGASAPVIAEVAKELGALTVGITPLAFSERAPSFIKRFRLGVLAD